MRLASLAEAFAFISNITSHLRKIFVPEIDLQLVFTFTMDPVQFIYDPFVMLSTYLYDSDLLVNSLSDMIPAVLIMLPDMAYRHLIG